MRFEKTEERNGAEDEFKEARSSNLEELVRLLGKKPVTKRVAEFGERAIEHLLPILRKGDMNARRAAILALAEIGKGNAEMLKSLMKRDDENVRAGVVAALSLIGEVDAVMEALKDESALVRLAAKNVLSLSGPYERLIEGLKNKDWRVKYGVSAALEEAGGKSDDAIIALLKALKDEGQRGLIRSILARIASKSPERFVNLITDSSELRISAMEVLLEVKDVEFLSSLLENENTRVREAAIVMLSMLEDEIAKSTNKPATKSVSKTLNRSLTKSLKDDSWFVRLVAVERIGKKLKGRPSKELTKLLNDVEIVREAVKEILKGGFD